MLSQSAWIGITIGVFFVGLIIGVGSFTGFMNMWNMPMQNPQTMLQDSQFKDQMMDQFLHDATSRNEIMASLTQDSDIMKLWMNNPRHIEVMTDMMNDNHDFAMAMMTPMINDPNLRLQMLGHMTENPEAMTQMMDSGMMMDGMTGSMMDSSMMNKDMIMQMMQDPEAREKMIEIMTKHVGQMQELLSMELTDEEFNSQMVEMMQIHMDEMQQLMPHQSMK